MGGVGSAGCVMADRLSQDGRSSVLIVEGGGTDVGQAKIISTLMWVTNIGSDTDWGNKTIPQPHLNNRVIPIPIGKIIGGGSSINATVWLKGDRADYDAWESPAGAGWGFSSILERLKQGRRSAGGGR